ncbi:hypothetical protein ACJX0J_016741, partial [Zea mays]
MHASMMEIRNNEDKFRKNILNSLEVQLEDLRSMIYLNNGNNKIYEKVPKKCFEETIGPHSRKTFVCIGVEGMIVILYKIVSWQDWLAFQDTRLFAFGTLNKKRNISNQIEEAHLPQGHDLGKGKRKKTKTL